MNGEKAAVFVPWWGPAPGWESQFIERAQHSKSLRLILVGDAAGFAPEFDVDRIPIETEEFEELARKVSGVNIRKRDPKYPRGQSLCELRPLLADMFPEALADLSWWGYGDMDVVWGDWDSFLTDGLLEQFDIITSNAKTINGPFCLFRTSLSRLYLKRQDLLENPLNSGLDESGLQAAVEIEAGNGRLRCLYPSGINAHDRHPVWNRCRLIMNGTKLHRVSRDGLLGGEILKFHFPAGSRWPLETPCRTK